MTFRTLTNTACRLNARYFTETGRRLPPLILLSDAARLPDPLPAAARLPQGSAVILRHYEWSREDRRALAYRLRDLTRDRRLLLLVAADFDLARDVEADGVHLPEWQVRQAGAHPARCDGLVTAAVHSFPALRRAAAFGADAALVSPVFATVSHPDRRVLGPLRLGHWLRACDLPVYALGGVAARTAPRLAHLPLAGLAGIGGLSS